MIIDCDSCVVRGLACGDCVVSVLLGAPPNVELDALGATRHRCAWEGRALYPDYAWNTSIDRRDRSDTRDRTVPVGERSLFVAERL